MGETDAELAARAAEAGAEVVRSLRGRALRRFAKDADDFATEADVAAERAILAVLRAARPDDAVVGEELGATGQADRTWLVDPLCGTHNYAVGTPLVAVNVALRVHGEITAAAVADPFSGEVFRTDGALAPDPASRIVDVDIDPPFPNRDRFSAARLLADPAFTARFRPRVLSTSLALAWVAAGKRAGYVTDGHLRDSVHFSAAIALCQAAGCVVSNLVGGPLHTGAQGLVAAADARTHADLVAVIAADQAAATDAAPCTGR
ncbi:inositol monophosphatase family protein [Actinokineospora fastidiosa]|uniref:Phosphatase n=1 Tax=Actinokineospora fastidiosa TaxID=1816 RepID=A0A918GQP3_9PSEU|nr:inositol monophosphatase family protein [Actinokineospora fastidiosa]GGS51471.1 phosphatase [Actinokineospora fastidiosa]